MITFDAFSDLVMLSMEDICRDIFREYAGSIKIKKEKVVVKNLVTIFNATLKLSHMKGFKAMSVRDLSQESGLSMGALYSYFKGKEELMDMIQNQGLRLTKKILHEQIMQETGASRRLGTAIRSHLYLSEVLHPWFYLSYMEARNLSKDAQKRAMTNELYTEKIFSDILDEGVESGEFLIENTLLTAAVIKAVLQDWYLKRWKYSRRKISVDEYAVFIISFIEKITVKNLSAGAHV